VRLIGPRNSVARALRGEPVGDVFDTSEFGIWSDNYRLAELWIDDVHDHAWAE
jgi:hypothetical protein